MKKISLVAVLFAVAVCFTAPQAGANDAYVGWDTPVSLEMDLSVVHTDAPDPNGDWMGWAYVGLNNSGTANWTGMRISIYDATVGGTTYDATSVKILDNLSHVPFVFAPNSISSWVIGTNASGHATIDVMFNSAVGPDEDVLLKVWTDNTAKKVPYFGVEFHAIPEPATGSLVALTGVVALFIRKRYGLR